jgi:hypothetical protein
VVTPLSHPAVFKPKLKNITQKWPAELASFERKLKLNNLWSKRELASKNSPTKADIALHQLQHF